MLLNKKVMLVGETDVGKTTMCQYLSNDKFLDKKTQSIRIVDGRIIDTPGEFVERRSRYCMLQVSSADADVVLLLKDPQREQSHIAPGFASMFSKPVIGVITKKDIATPQMLDDAAEVLERAGVCKVFAVSSINGDGYYELLSYIDGAQ